MEQTHPHGAQGSEVTVPPEPSTNYTDNQDNRLLPITVSEARVYDGISAYPFQYDQEFQAGLASILANPNNLSQNQQELELQAKCYYFARKNGLPPINAATYLAHINGGTSTEEDWKNLGREGEPTHMTSNGSLNPNAAPFTPLSTNTVQNPGSTASINGVAVTADLPSQVDPPYPTSFAEIADLIARNQPIPGIEQIPDTVLELGSSKPDKSVKRRKPWEKDEESSEDMKENGQEATGHVYEEVDASTAVPKSALNTEGKKNGGVVHILKPDAVPESGLIAKE